MTETPEPETGDPLVDAVVFAAEATVILGASFLASFGLAELLRRKDCKEREHG